MSQISHLGVKLFENVLVYFVLILSVQLDIRKLIFLLELGNIDLVSSALLHTPLNVLYFLWCDALQCFI